MSQLIQAFKQEHLHISDLLLKVRELGVQSQEGKDLVLSAKKMLLAHLNKEDRFLYPVLRAAAEQDDNLKKELTDYALDMDKTTADVMTFFMLYESGENTAENFKTDCDKIITALTKRITKEETVLYKAYEKIQRA